MESVFNAFRILPRIFIGLFFIVEIVLFRGFDAIQYILELMEMYLNNDIISSIFFIFILLSISSMGLYLLNVIISILQQIFYLILIMLFKNKNLYKMISNSKIYILLLPLERALVVLLNDNICVASFLEFMRFRSYGFAYKDPDVIDKMFEQLYSYLQTSHAQNYVDIKSYVSNVTQEQMKLDNIEKLIFENLQFLICVILFFILLYQYMKLNLIIAIVLVIVSSGLILLQAMKIKHKYLLTYLYLFFDNFTVGEGSHVQDRDTIM